MSDFINARPRVRRINGEALTIQLVESPFLQVFGDNEVYQGL